MQAAKVSIRRRNSIEFGAATCIARQRSCSFDPGLVSRFLPSNLGYRSMKTKLALSAFVLALALTACAKKEEAAAPEAAPAPAAAPAEAAPAPAPEAAPAAPEAAPAPAPAN